MELDGRPPKALDERRLNKRRLFKRGINKRHLRLGLALLGLLFVLTYVAVPPWSLHEKSHLVGYAICHQIPERTFVLGGRHLPLCARCTGTYLGIAIGLGAALVLRRGRAGELLSTPMLVLMGAFILIMGVDGINSYLVLLGRAPLLYEPRNWLRTATGTLNGIALSLIVLPVFNYTLWKDARPIRPLKSAWNLLPMLAVGALIIALLQAGPSWMLYPMTLLSAGGVLCMLTMVNTMVLLILARRDSLATRWKEAALPLLGGLTATLIELTAIGVVRYLLTGTMGWPPA